MPPKPHFIPTLTCALCAKTAPADAYRLQQTLAVCNSCIDRLIGVELERVSICVPAAAKGVH